MNLKCAGSAAILLFFPLGGRKALYSDSLQVSRDLLDTVYLEHLDIIRMEDIVKKVRYEMTWVNIVEQEVHVAPSLLEKNLGRMGKVS